MSPIKAARAAAVAEKKATAARKVAFNADKHALAANLLSYLDEHVTSSQLSILSASTGGVQVTWSKTLRSTAGRANWRRSVTRPQTGSPIKGSPVKGLVRGEKVKVEHFANIELAEKVIDSEERLVNTLAHEFCHLANFMVSGVRDQPHGASFKRWADEATACLARAGIGQNGMDDRVRESWGKCKVTTKHSYEIEWKYLWCCVGREQSDAMKFLNVEGGKGCGAEYGRHSKSIDTERMRCGRCKGKLVQVRPTPRATAKKNNNGGKGGEKEGKAKKGSVGRNSSDSESSRSSTGTEGLVTKLKEIEVVELSN
jgi:predicted SprT family Zn-dependent metalloprotease